MSSDQTARFRVATERVDTLTAGRFERGRDLDATARSVPAGTWHAVDVEGRLLCAAALPELHIFERLDFARGLERTGDRCDVCTRAVLAAVDQPR